MPFTGALLGRPKNKKGRDARMHRCLCITRRPGPHSRACKQPPLCARSSRAGLSFAYAHPPKASRISSTIPLKSSSSILPVQGQKCKCAGHGFALSTRGSALVPRKLGIFPEAPFFAPQKDPIRPGAQPSPGQRSALPAHFWAPGRSTPPAVRPAGCRPPPAVSRSPGRGCGADGTHGRW